jgi:hypothetical protein
MELFKRLLPILLLVWQQSCLAEGISADRVKSAYILNFARFVEWPDTPVRDDDRIKLCVVGSNVLGSVLLELDGRRVGSRELHVVQYANADRSLVDCHVVFIGASEERHLVSIIRSLEDAPVLTISDIDDFAERGGGIGLRYREDKIVFEINLASAQKARLRLPGQLLNLASRIFRR